jgi:hypothetical protein
MERHTPIPIPLLAFFLSSFLTRAHMYIGGGGRGAGMD